MQLNTNGKCFNEGNLRPALRIFGVIGVEVIQSVLNFDVLFPFLWFVSKTMLVIISVDFKADEVFDSYKIQEFSPKFQVLSKFPVSAKIQVFEKKI